MRAWAPDGQNQLEQIRANGQGLGGQNFDRAQASTSSVMNDGTVYYMMVPFRADDVVSAISIVVGNAGAGVTVSKVALCTSAGALARASADQGTAWQSTGTKLIALTAQYKVPSDQVMYIACLCKASTTLPSLLQIGGAPFAPGSVASFPLPYGTLAAQTDIPATATIVATSALCFWAGWN